MKDSGLPAVEVDHLVVCLEHLRPFLSMPPPYRIFQKIESVSFNFLKKPALGLKQVFN
jgi:hypothetical protein